MSSIEIKYGAEHEHGRWVKKFGSKTYEGFLYVGLIFRIIKFIIYLIFMGFVFYVFYKIATTKEKKGNLNLNNIKNEIKNDVNKTKNVLSNKMNNVKNILNQS